ncbi:MAG: dipicolinate synthase subunit DpsA [Oscillospiraceae bacterium]|nr:dipicolinate synthase subunit DpsA [Oscillospiraceae bacterium]
MKFTVIGGDMRQAKLAELLAEDGHTVSTFALDKLRLDGRVSQSPTARESVSGAECVVLPLPVTTREGILNAPLSSGLHTTREILSVLGRDQLICGGRLDENTRELTGSMGLTVADYYQREELAVLNADITAEGAIQLIMEETPITVSGARILVIGYGRIGRLLSAKLRALGADVTASARRWRDLAWIQSAGLGSVATEQIDALLPCFDVVVNTVPAMILGEDRLRLLKPGCLCLDLASRPGGVDFSAAARLGVKAVWALSLPGEAAPVTSGAAIRDTIYHIIREAGC